MGSSASSLQTRSESSSPARDDSDVRNPIPSSALSPELHPLLSTPLSIPSHEPVQLHALPSPRECDPNSTPLPTAPPLISYRLLGDGKRVCIDKHGNDDLVIQQVMTKDLPNLYPSRNEIAILSVKKPRKRKLADNAVHDGGGGASPKEGRPKRSKTSASAENPPVRDIPPRAQRASAASPPPLSKHSFGDKSAESGRNAPSTTTSNAVQKKGRGQQKTMEEKLEIIKAKVRLSIESTPSLLSVEPLVKYLNECQALPDNLTLTSSSSLDFAESLSQAGHALAWEEESTQDHVDKLVSFGSSTTQIRGSADLANGLALCGAAIVGDFIRTKIWPQKLEEANEKNFFESDDPFRKALRAASEPPSSPLNLKPRQPSCSRLLASPGWQKLESSRRNYFPHLAHLLLKFWILERFAPRTLLTNDPDSALNDSVPFIISLPPFLPSPASSTLADTTLWWLDHFLKRAFFSLTISETARSYTPLFLPIVEYWLRHPLHYSGRAGTITSQPLEEWNEVIRELFSPTHSSDSSFVLKLSTSLIPLTNALSNILKIEFPPLPALGSPLFPHPSLDFKTISPKTPKEAVQVPVTLPAITATPVTPTRRSPARELLYWMSYIMYEQSIIIRDKPEESHRPDFSDLIPGICRDMEARIAASPQLLKLREKVRDIMKELPDHYDWYKPVQPALRAAPTLRKPHDSTTSPHKLEDFKIRQIFTLLVLRVALAGADAAVFRMVPHDGWSGEAEYLAWRKIVISNESEDPKNEKEGSTKTRYLSPKRRELCNIRVYGAPVSQMEELKNVAIVERNVKEVVKALDGKPGWIAANKALQASVPLCKSVTLSRFHLLSDLFACGLIQQPLPAHVSDYISDLNKGGMKGAMTLGLANGRLNKPSTARRIYDLEGEGVDHNFAEQLDKVVNELNRTFGGEDADGAKLRAELTARNHNSTVPFTGFDVDNLLCKVTHSSFHEVRKTFASHYTTLPLLFDLSAVPSLNGVV
ncbi:hypothetical protein JCM5353_005770 [Sporobolomyces roseus]